MIKITINIEDEDIASEIYEVLDQVRYDDRFDYRVDTNDDTDKLIMKAYDQVGILRKYICDTPLDQMIDVIELLEIIMLKHFDIIVKLKDTIE